MVKRKYAPHGYEAQHVTLDDGRKLEYLETGNPKADTVLVTMKGYKQTMWDAIVTEQVMKLWNKLPAEEIIRLCGKHHAERIEKIKETGITNDHVRMITPNLAGHGQSDPYLHPTIMSSMGDIEQLLNQLGIKEFAAAGISGGVPDVLALKTRVGERMKAVTCISGIGRITPWNITKMGPLEIAGLLASRYPLNQLNLVQWQFTRERESKRKDIPAEADRFIASWRKDEPIVDHIPLLKEAWCAELEDIYGNEDEPLEHGPATQERRIRNFWKDHWGFRIKKELKAHYRNGSRDQYLHFIGGKHDTYVRSFFSKQLYKKMRREGIPARFDELPGKHALFLYVIADTVANSHAILNGEPPLYPIHDSKATPSEKIPTHTRPRLKFPKDWLDRLEDMAANLFY